MLKKFGKNISMALVCSSILVFTSAPVFAGTNVSANGKATYIPISTSIAKASRRTLSDIVLTTLTNIDGKTLTAGDTTDVFYAGYIATDNKGNSTTNYRLMAKGLILTGDHMLVTSTPDVLAQLVKDPTDSSKGLIKVTATSNPISMDMAVVITAMTWTGKSSQINTILKKQLSVYTFTLKQPSESIDSGESKVIPFIAVDQNGNAITKFSELNGYVNLYNAYFVENTDGTASVKNIPTINTGTEPIAITISAITQEGRYSSITINIK
jgi:hypothetical protein